MNKKYQVFISSTYEDLKDQRNEVIKTCLKMGHIPVGMEMFNAADEEQWEIIKRTIDACEYYCVIVARRYGSRGKAGISFTEMEFDYATSQKIPVLRFLLKEDAAWPGTLSDKEASDIEALTAFKKKLKEKMLSFWSEGHELSAQIALALSQATILYERPGWIRGNAAAGEENLRQVNELRIENEVLKSKNATLEAITASPPENLAQGNDVHTFTIEYSIYYGHGRGSIDKSEDVKLSWNDLFSIITPTLLSPLNEGAAKKEIRSRIAERLGRTYITMKDYDLDTIGHHYVALGLLKIYSAGTVKGGLATFWQVTDAGSRYLIELRTVRKDTSIFKDQQQ